MAADAAGGAEHVAGHLAFALDGEVGAQGPLHHWLLLLGAAGAIEVHLVDLGCRELRHEMVAYLGGDGLFRHLEGVHARRAEFLYQLVVFNEAPVSLCGAAVC